jgi:hypothetical protein
MQSEIDFAQIQTAKKQNIRKQSSINNYKPDTSYMPNNNMNATEIDPKMDLDFSSIQINSNSQNNIPQRVNKSLDMTSGNISFQNHSNMIYEPSIKDINLNKFKSSNNPSSNGVIDMDFNKIQYSSNKRSGSSLNAVSVSESLSSLKNVDLGSVLNSINFTGNDNSAAVNILEDKKENRESPHAFRNRAASTFTSMDFNNSGYSLPGFNTLNSSNFGNQFNQCGVNNLSNFNSGNMGQVNTNTNMNMNKNSLYLSQGNNSSQQNNFNQNGNINMHRQSQDLFGLNNILLCNAQLEDVFDPINIKKQIRGVIIVKINI